MEEPVQAPQPDEVLQMIATSNPPQSVAAQSPRQVGWADGLHGRHHRPYRWPGEAERSEYAASYRLGAEQALDLAKLEDIERSWARPY